MYKSSYPSLRVLFKTEGIPHRRIQRVAATATGYNFSMSTVMKWCSGDRKWPDTLRNSLYRYIRSQIVGLKRREFNRLIEMTHEQIVEAEAEYDHD